MIVVSDTSPIRALGNLGLLALLRQLYQTVVIPRAVALELSRAPTGQFSVEVDEFGPSIGVQIASAKDMALVEKFLTELDPGESEALALAIELNADVVLIDETAGRSAARRHGLEVIGSESSWRPSTGGSSIPWLP